MTASQQELAVLGRQVGVGLAINPQTGAVLSLVNLPGFDNNAFENPASNRRRSKIILHRPISRSLIALFPGNTSRVPPSSRSTASRR